LRLLLALHPDGEEAPDSVQRFVRYGPSPRGAQAMVASGKVRALMDDRFNVSIDDVKASALPALRHRIGLNFEGQAEQVNPDDLIAEAIAAVESSAGQDVPV